MIGIPLAQYAGFGAPTQISGGSPVIVVSRILTNAELVALNATPITLIPARSGVLLVPFYFSRRSIKPGAVAWTAGHTFQLIHEGDNTGLTVAGLQSNLNTAASLDQFQAVDAINIASVSFLTFNRVNKAIQVRSSTVPNQGAGSDATVVISVAVCKLKMSA